MRLFMDTEFTGLHQNTTLISLGIISEDNKTFYAEFMDFDKTQCDDWIKNNVIKKLEFFNMDDIEMWDKTENWGGQEHSGRNNEKPYLMNFGYDPERNPISNFSVYGNTKGIKFALETWLRQFEKIEMWSDCLAYDWVLFNNIFGNAFNLPKDIYYIPFDLSTVFKIFGVDPDINREEFVSNNLNLCSFDKSGKEIDLKEEKHNSLWDAFIIKCCFEIITNKTFLKKEYIQNEL